MVGIREGGRSSLRALIFPGSSDPRFNEGCVNRNNAPSHTYVQLFFHRTSLVKIPLKTRV